MLITTQAVWASPMPAISVVPSPETPSFFQIEIPEDLATVEEVYEAPASQDPKVILHIQNVHGNYQAQVQVKKMLDYFYKNYGFKIIFCEGAAEKLDPKYLELFPEKKDNLTLADELAKKGQLTGPELYMMDAPKDVQAIGIEQTDLYRGNYDAFKAVYKSKKGTDSFLKLLDSRLELLSSRFLTRDMRRILSEWQKFHEGHREFMPFVKHLADESQKFLNLDLNSLFAQVEWPQTARLLVLQSMEADLKQDEAMAERDKLLAFLKEHKASGVLISGLEKMEEKTISLQRLAIGKGEDPFQPRKLLERLAEEAAPMGFQFHQYPNFSLYAGYTILESELDSKVLFQEIEKLFDRILESLTVSEKEKNLLELYKDLELLKKLVALELTRTDWDQATYRKNWIKPQSLVDRLDKMSASGFVTEDLVVSKEIPTVFDAAFSFYDFARQREFAFYDTIEREMTVQKADRAILVTGGFHADGLSDIFRSKNINYGILTPRMGGDFDKTNYIQTMMESHPTIFDLAQLESVLATGNPVSRALEGQNPVGFVKSLLGVYLDDLNQNARERVASGKIEDLVNLLLYSNGAFKFAWGPLAGFVPTKTKGEDGSFRYQFRFFNPNTNKMETLKDPEGLPYLLILNPIFQKDGAGPAVYISKFGKENPVLMNLAEFQPTELPGRVAPKNKQAETTSFLLSGRLSGVTGAASGRYAASSIPEFDDRLGANQNILPPIPEPWRALTPKDLRGVSPDDFLGRGGGRAADFPMAVALLSMSFPKNSRFIETILELQNEKNKSQAGVTVEGTAEELAALGEERGGISSDYLPLIRFIGTPSTEPGAVAVRLEAAFQELSYGALAKEVEILLKANPKEYFALLLPEGTTPEDVARIKDEFFMKAIETVHQRLLIESQAGLNSSEISRILLTLMQRVKDLPPGRLSDLAKKFFAQFEQATIDNVSVDWTPYYGNLVAGITLPADASQEVKDGLVRLGIAFTAAVSRLGGAEIDDKIAEYLVRNGDNSYSLNKKTVLGLLSAMLKVWSAYDKALKTSA